MKFDDRIFNVRDTQEAKNIILTPQGGLSPNNRWDTETPYLVDLILKEVPSNSWTNVLDYGCGLGRLSKELIIKKGSTLVGADTSWSMRALAHDYVRSNRFITCSPSALETLIGGSRPFNVAVSVWALQHVKDLREAIQQYILGFLDYRGYLFVVNDLRRLVPTNEGWYDDGLNILEILRESMDVVSEGKLDPRVVTQAASDCSFWGVYRSKI